MNPLPPGPTLTDTLFPDTTLFRSVERQRMVLENPRVDLRVSADPATRLHELKWIVDRLHTEHFVLAEIPYREARLVRIASYDDFVKAARSEEHTSELQSLMRNSYGVFCLKEKRKKQINNSNQ